MSAELKQLRQIVAQCRANLRALPKESTVRCDIGRMLRKAMSRIAVLECEQDQNSKQEERND